MRHIWPYVKWLLLPFAFLYGIAVWIYHKLYDLDLMRSVQFDIPVIAVGNLSVGGTGKTMLIEYLLDHFSETYQIGVLSRGYKRKTSGYRTVKPEDDAQQAGDEPAQLKKKHRRTPIAVASNRALAIPEFLGDHPQTELILLDDAFQHRAVEPGLSILLTSYHNLFTRDFLLPVGRLREWWSGYQRAQLILVTKCPPSLSLQEQEQIRQEINPLPSQQIYFSTLEYDSPYPLVNKADFAINQETAVVLLAGIAHTHHLKEYVEASFRLQSTHSFPDHYNYVLEDLWEIKGAYHEVDRTNKIILTTEKDAVRLMPHADWLRKSGLPLYCLPVKMRFLGQQAAGFRQNIEQFVGRYL